MKKTGKLDKRKIGDSQQVGVLPSLAPHHGLSHPGCQGRGAGSACSRDDGGKEQLDGGKAVGL